MPRKKLYVAKHIPAATQPCGHDERFEMEWREVSNAGAVSHVWFCIACNYEIITKRIADRVDEKEEEFFKNLGKGIRETM